MGPFAITGATGTTRADWVLALTALSTRTGRQDMARPYKVCKTCVFSLDSHLQVAALQGELEDGSEVAIKAKVSLRVIRADPS